MNITHVFHNNECSSDNFTNDSDSSLVPGDETGFSSNKALKAIFAIIAIFSTVGNLFLCAVILRRKKMLRKNHNTLILNLAVADALTGIFIVATPDYVIDRRAFPYPDGIAGEIYCRMIGSTYILFIFGKASTLTIMFLAIDRWYSIVKPIMYKTTFSRKRLYYYITLIWIISCVTQLNELFITVVEDGLCTFRIPFYGVEFERILILIHVTLTFYIPSMITWCSFAHIKYHMTKARFRRSINDIKATERLLRMCALAAFFLSICWLPAETFFITYKFEVLKLPFNVSLFLSVLAMFNSCVNPWIYCLSNKEYRREFIKLLCCTRSNAIGLTELITRVLSSQSQYSFTNVLALPASDPTDVTNVRSMEMRAMSNPESMGLHLTSSKATLKRYSCNELFSERTTNGKPPSHIFEVATNKKKTSSHMIDLTTNGKPPSYIFEASTNGKETSSHMIDSTTNGKTLEQTTNSKVEHVEAAILNC